MQRSLSQPPGSVWPRQTDLNLAAHPTIQVLMLGLGDEIFAIEAGMVREILDPVPVTRVSGARAFVPSLINVRGNVIPLADMRERFGMPLHANTPDTRVVVIEVIIKGDPVVVGIMADKVYEVAEILHSQTQQLPRLGMQWRPEFIRYITKWNDNFVIVPDFERILD